MISLNTDEVISDVDYEGPRLRNYLLIGDWSDNNGINDWAWQWQRYNDWKNFTFKYFFRFLSQHFMIVLLVLFLFLMFLFFNMIEI